MVGKAARPTRRRTNAAGCAAALVPRAKTDVLCVARARFASAVLRYCASRYITNGLTSLYGIGNPGPATMKSVIASPLILSFSTEVAP